MGVGPRRAPCWSGDFLQQMEKLLVEKLEKDSSAGVMRSQEVGRLTTAVLRTSIPILLDSIWLAASAAGAGVVPVRCWHTAGQFYFASSAAGAGAVPVRCWHPAGQFYFVSSAAGAGAVPVRC